MPKHIVIQDCSPEKMWVVVLKKCVSSKAGKNVFFPGSTVRTIFLLLTVDTLMSPKAKFPSKCQNFSQIPKFPGKLARFQLFSNHSFKLWVGVSVIWFHKVSMGSSILLHVVINTYNSWFFSEGRRNLCNGDILCVCVYVQYLCLLVNIVTQVG